MSRKWEQVKAWDDAHLTGAWSPLRWVLRLFSSVWFGVSLLVFVCLYGTLASIPVGMLVLIPTWAIYVGLFVVWVALLAGVPVWAGCVFARWRGASKATVFVMAVLGGLVLAAGASYGFVGLVWPQLRYDAATGEGLRLFADFAQRYRATTLRRLPGFEMTEMEFYGWWPLRTVLLVFVFNMIIATIRRIEFRFVNIGVLSVHTGIILIALGSVYYARLKQEGDMILLSDEAVAASGQTVAAGGSDVFFDRIKPALFVREAPPSPSSAPLPPRQIPLDGLPRYNDYVAGLHTEGASERAQERELSLPIGAFEWGDVEVVGFVSYAEMAEQVMPAERARELYGDSIEAEPLRRVELWSTLTQSGEVGNEPVGVFTLLPRDPAERIEALGDVFEVEYAVGLNEARWSDMTIANETGTRGMIVIERAGQREVIGAAVGEGVELDDGTRVRAQRIDEEPMLPIISQGHEGTTSSVAIVDVVLPSGERFERWVYSRYPAIDQDFVKRDEGDEQGQSAAGPMMGNLGERRAADTHQIRIGFVDDARVRVVIDERAGGRVRAVARVPADGAAGREVRVAEGLGVGDRVDIAPEFWLTLGGGEEVARVEVPVVVPEEERNKDAIGTHDMAAIAVRVTGRDEYGAGGDGGGRVVWVPFSKYAHVVETGGKRVVDIGGGRRVELVFGRVQHRLPGMGLVLADFEMVPYPHDTRPRDFVSRVHVLTQWDASGGRHGESWQAWGWDDRVLGMFTAKTSLNEPLLVRVPFQAREGVPGVVNGIGRVLSVVVPTQFKFSQAGWDEQGWRQSQQQVEAGLRERPGARFTILGVGNNPGIYVIAFGSVLMAVGIPWAFYVKPMLLRMKKRKLAERARQAAQEKKKKVDRAGRQAGEDAETRRETASV